MQESLLIHAAFKAGLHDQKTMMIDGFKMSEKTL